MVSCSRPVRESNFSLGYDLWINEWVVVPDMKLSPNVGSDRSWVWNAAADVSEGEPEAQTLAIRFANSDSMLNFYPTSIEMLTSFAQTRTLLRMHLLKPSKRTKLCSLGRKGQASGFKVEMWHAYTT